MQTFLKTITTCLKQNASRSLNVCFVGEQMDDSILNDSTDNEVQIQLHIKGMDSDYKTDEDDARAIPQRSSLRTSGKMNYQDLNNKGTTDSNNNTRGKAAKKNTKTETAPTVQQMKVAERKIVTLLDKITEKDKEIKTLRTKIKTLEKKKEEKEHRTTQTINTHPHTLYNPSEIHLITDAKKKNLAPALKSEFPDHRITEHHNILTTEDLIAYLDTTTFTQQNTVYIVVLGTEELRHGKEWVLIENLKTLSKKTSAQTYLAHIPQLEPYKDDDANQTVNTYRQQINKFITENFNCIEITDHSDPDTHLDRTGYLPTPLGAKYITEHIRHTLTNTNKKPTYSNCPTATSTPIAQQPPKQPPRRTTPHAERTPPVQQPLRQPITYRDAVTTPPNQQPSTSNQITRTSPLDAQSLHTTIYNPHFKQQHTSQPISSTTTYHNSQQTTTPPSPVPRPLLTEQITIDNTHMKHIIGQKGQQITKIESDNNVKVITRRKAEDTLVIVQGRTQTGIQGAMLSIRNILDLRNAEARVRQRQQIERQTISSSTAPTSTPHPNNPALSGEQVTELLTIPTDKAGYVIGAGKQTLDNIAHTSHTHIEATPSHIENATLFTFKGPREGVNEAMDKIIQLTKSANNTPSSQIECKYHRAGNCKYKDKCRYKHSTHTIITDNRPQYTQHNIPQRSDTTTKSPYKYRRTGESHRERTPESFRSQERRTPERRRSSERRRSPERRSRPRHTNRTPDANRRSHRSPPHRSPHRSRSSQRPRR